MKKEKKKKHKTLKNIATARKSVFSSGRFFDDETIHSISPNQAASIYRLKRDTQYKRRTPSFRWKKHKQQNDLVLRRDLAQ